jgi:NAD(P)H dehydrogenase (quinone)
MYAITGITGQIGGVIGRILLAEGQPIRAVLRGADKGRAWTDSGCEVALATIEDAASLTVAFRGAEGVFVLVPPNFDPEPGFPEARAIGAALRSALEAARSEWFIFPPSERRPVSPTC